MTDAQIWNTWLLSLAGVTVIILAAAVLLILIYNRAQRILKLALAALGLVKTIKENTMPVWGLEQTNDTAVKILGNAETIRDVGAALANALHGADVKAGRS